MHFPILSFSCTKQFSDLELIAKNVFLTRDLVSEPSNELNPESYAEICQSLKVAGLEIEVLGKKEMEKLEMYSLLGVGQGSAKESKMVIFKYFIVGGKFDIRSVQFGGFFEFVLL